MLYIQASADSLSGEEKKSIEEDVSSDYALIFEEDVREINAKLKEMKNKRSPGQEETITDISNSVVILENEAGTKLRVSSAEPFHFDVHHNTIEDYQKARHEHELVRRVESFLHIDAAHCPIGGNMAWSTNLDPEERLKGGRYVLDFMVEMI